MDWAGRIHDHRHSLFTLISASALALLCAGFLLDIPWAGLAAFGIVGLLVILLDFRILFYLLLFTLPLSNEIRLFEGFSLYVPTEPLTILLLGLSIIYVLMRPSLLRGAFWKHPITILIGLHLLWIGCSTITSTYPIVSVKYTLAKLWFIGTYYFLGGYLLKHGLTYRRLFWLLFIPTMGGIVYTLIRHAATGFLFDEVNRVMRPIFRNHVNYGVWITAMLPLMVLARTWYRKQSLGRLGIDLSILVTLVAIYFSYTRGAWVALACIPAFYLVIRYRMAVPAIAASLIGVLLFTATIFQGNKYLQYAPEFNKTIYHEDFSDHMSATFQMQDMSTVERFYRWIAAVRMSGEKPVTGYGPGNFVKNYKAYTVSSYSTYISDNEEGSSVHNYFLTMLTEQGVPGLLIFIALIVAAVLMIQRLYHRHEGPERAQILAIGCCFLVLLVNNFFSDLLEADKLGPLFFLCMVLLVRTELDQDKEEWPSRLED